ncbi:sulfatase-like hydrolase/transferase, partial [Shewanella sp.]
DQQLKAMLANVSNDTLVIITGVNGKMFTSNSDEANRNLSPQSVKVPLVIHWPNTGASKVKYRTSHYGIAPTLMTHVLGCTNNTTDYSAGRSLLQPDKETWIYIGDSRIFAIYQEAEVTVIDRHGKYRIYDENYEHRLNKKMSAPELIEVMREGRRFYNH